MISTKDFMDLKFSLLYVWNEERIILSDYQKNFFKVDLNNRCLKKLSIKDHEYYHSFETCSGIIAKIGEEKLEILFNKNKKIQYSSAGFKFLSGKFLKESKKNIFFLLSGDKRDLSKSKIQKYIIEI